MLLTVLGAGPAYTDRLGASGACYLVSDEGTHVLLDLGQGSFPRIFPHVAPEDLAAVVVSHLHPDHFIDLVPMRHYLRYEFEPPRRMRVLGPDGLAGRLDALHAEPGFAAAALDAEWLGEAPDRIGALGLEARLVAHTEESYGVRVAGAGGPGLVYSGDCGRATPDSDERRDECKARTEVARNLVAGADEIQNRADARGHEADARVKAGEDSCKAISRAARSRAIATPYEPAANARSNNCRICSSSMASKTRSDFGIGQPLSLCWFASG